MFRYLVVALLVLGGSVGAAENPNLYPDPGFEGTGVDGVARSGEKAGYLKVGPREHWNALAANLTVEPFARYRVTEWVKGRVGGGSFFAPYCYDWDSYEWAFVAFREAPTTGEWQKMEVTFVSPTGTMCVNPLAYIEAENSELWVDDVVVEKIAEPAAVIAELQGRANLSDNEKKILARWLVKQGDLAGADKLMQTASELARADLATVIARVVTDPAQRLPYLVEMVAAGSITYNRGPETFNELAGEMGPPQRMQIATLALQRNPRYDRCGRGARWLISGNASGDPLATVGEGLAQVQNQLDALTGALRAVPEDSPARPELLAAQESLRAAAERLEANRRQLGRCRLRLGGKPVSPRTHAIIVPDAATPQELYAARDLRHHLELITGRLFPIKTDTAAAGAPGFCIGKTKLALSCGIKFEALGMEGLEIRTFGPSVLLAGNQRGCLYATYQFLEDYLGCRWFTPDCATWPTTGQITVPSVSRRFVPPLEFRQGDYPVARNGAFAARLRLNGDNHGMTTEQGGQRGVAGLAHTFAALVPPERYFATHPEYFSLVNGRRQSGYAQLCLTNPEVLKLCIAGVRSWIKQSPQKKVFSVSQNDTANYCECDDCKRIAEAEGSQAGPMVRFVNAIADDIAADYPDVAIETLAYQYTRKPPKLTKPRPNVIICLCSIECCFIHPLGNDPFNKSFVDDIKGWNKICNRLWIWDYVINYAHSICPFPNLYVLKPNIDFFLGSGVKGIYEESCYFTKGSELQELRNYIIAKTLWDPAYDTDKAIDEFCAAFYGAAAKPVREYINLIHRETQRDPKSHVAIYTHPKSYLTPQMLADAAALFDRAEAAVQDDPLLLHRVQVARLPVLYAQITLGTTGSYVEKDLGLMMEGGSDVSSLAQRFREIAQAEGVTSVREGGPDASVDAWLARIPQASRRVPLEKLSNGKLSLDILPELGGRIWRMRTADGRDLLKVGGNPKGYQPLEGGYEEYGSNGYRGPGWSEPYKLLERGNGFVVLEAYLSNGLRLTRRIALDPQKALVTITSTLTNATAQAQTACLRVHPEFTVSSLPQTTVRVLGPDGKWRVQTLHNPANPAEEKDEFLRESDTPNGAWAIADAGSGIGIINRFPRAQIAQALLNRNGAQSRVNLELYTPEVTLAAGKSLALENSYEVVGVAELP